MLKEAEKNCQFKKEIETIVFSTVNEYIYSNFNCLHSKEKNDYIVSKVSKSICNYVYEFRNNSNSSNFKPKYFNFRLESKVYPDYCRPVDLKGEIDRVDFNFEDKCFKVIDYNFENKFNISSVIYGINIKPLIYLNLFSKESFKKSGVIYCSINNIMNNPDNKLTTKEISTDTNSKSDEIFSINEHELSIFLKYSDFFLNNIIKNIIDCSAYKIPTMLENKKKLCENCEYKDICKDRNIRYISMEKIKSLDEVINFMVDLMERNEKIY